MPINIGPIQIGPDDAPAAPAPATAAAAPAPAGPGPEHQQTLNGLIATHGQVVGQAAPVTFKDPVTGLPVNDPSGGLTYTFADGSTAQIGTKGELGPVTPAKSETTVQTPQDLLAKQGIYVVGGKVYQKNPKGGPPVETDASKATQVLADASTAADAQLKQAQTAKSQLDAQLAADPENRALQARKTQADTALADAQTAAQSANAAATAIDTQLKQAAAPGQIALTAGQTNLAQAQAASVAAKTALDNDPTNVALQRAATAADTALKNAQAAAQTKPTALTADAVSPYVPTMDSSGNVTFQPNANQQTASEATSQLAQQLGVKVAAGSMSEAQAQDIITGAVNAMNAQAQQTSAQASMLNAQTAQQNADTSAQQNITTAAGDVLSNTRGNAQTGAGMLQQRAQSASGMLQNILGQATGAKNLMSAPAGLGEQLVNGIGGWTADLMGGQSTLDSAARLVQQADPQSSLADPTMQTAVGVLHQMLDKYQQATGMPHPAVTATQAAQQSAQNGGMTAPATFNPQASTAALNQAGFMDTPQGRAAAQQVNPQLLASFIAPPMAATLAPTTVS